MVEEIVKTVLKELKEIAKTQTVVGEPIILDEATVIPVSKVSIGFGIGGTEGVRKGNGYEGTGGGISIEPLAFIVIKKEKVELITLQKAGSVLADVIDLVPKVMDKVKAMQHKEETDTETGETP